AGDGHHAAGLGRIDDVVGGDGVEGDGGGNRGVDAVGLGVGRSCAVAGGVGGGDAGIDGGVGIGGQVGAGDVDREGAARHQPGVVSAVDGEGDGVATLDVAADGAGDGHHAAGLGRIDDVVRGDGVEGDGGGNRGGGC